MTFRMRQPILARHPRLRVYLMQAGDDFRNLAADRGVIAAQWLRGFTQGTDLWLLSPCLHRVPQIPLPL